VPAQLFGSWDGKCQSFSREGSAENSKRIARRAGKDSHGPRKAHRPRVCSPLAHLAHLAQEYVPFASDPRYQGVLEASDDEGRTVIMHARSLCTSSCVAPPGTLHMNENAARRGARTKIVQGWPKLWANFRPLIGIFSQSVGPSLTIWANPVQFSFRMPPSSRPPRRRTGSARPGAGGRRAPAGPAARATRRPTRRRWRRRCYSWTRSLSYYAPVLLFIWKFFMGGCMREHIQ
jgi:hypothetical protein